MLIAVSKQHSRKIIADPTPHFAAWKLIITGAFKMSAFTGLFSAGCA